MLAELYKAKSSFPLSQAEALFQDIPIPTLSSANRESLVSPVTAEEVLLAIKTLKPHKRLGPDGLSCTNFKKCASILDPLLSNFFNALLHHSFG